MTYPLASVYISNECCKSGNANIDDVIMFSLNVSKVLCFFPSHLKTCVMLVKAYKGYVINEKLAINFHQYWTTPKKLLTSVVDVGLRQFTLTSTLEGSIFNSQPLLCNPSTC